MKHDINLISGFIGALGACLKGFKKKHKLQMIIVNLLIGGVLAFLAIDLIPIFIDNPSEKTLMLVSFSIGYVANELTDNMEDLVNSFFEGIKTRFGKTK